MLQVAVPRQWQTREAGLKSHLQKCHKELYALYVANVDARSDELPAAKTSEQLFSVASEIYSDGPSRQSAGREREEATLSGVHQTV